MVRKIKYSLEFFRLMMKLPPAIVKTAERKIAAFINDPFYPSLRVHRLRGPLSGFWSMSVTDNYRIIFNRQEGGDIILVSIGKHDIYKSL